ncbi:MAG: thermonuclease family protein, partial [Alphaproteobacteria bacterium]
SSEDPDEPDPTEPAAVEPIEVEPAVVEPAAEADPIEPVPLVDPVPEPTPEPEVAAPVADLVVEPAPALEEPAIVADDAAPTVVVQEDGTIVGEATAVESATILIGDTRIMLYGLESVYPPQTCSIDGQIWECWAAAFRQLQTYLAEGPVSCTPVGAPDIMGRVLALCDLSGESLNARYVRSGFALAIEVEMPEYALVEEAAREEGIGLWQGVFIEPGDFRLSRGIFVRRP